MTDTSKAVSHSYASQDAGPALRICKSVRAAEIEVWFDQSELRGGDAWDSKIRRQIRDCALFIPMISSSTQVRLEGYFRREWRLPVDRMQDMMEGTPFLLPVVVDATQDRHAQLPEGFRAVQWTRLPGGEATPVFARHVAGLLKPGAVLPASPWESSPRAPSARSYEIRPTGADAVTGGRAAGCRAADPTGAADQPDVLRRAV